MRDYKRKEISNVLLIIYSILTFGLNWVFFFIHYGMKEYTYKRLINLNYEGSYESRKLSDLGKVSIVISPLAIWFFSFLFLFIIFLLDKDSLSFLFGFYVRMNIVIALSILFSLLFTILYFFVLIGKYEYTLKFVSDYKIKTTKLGMASFIVGVILIIPILSFSISYIVDELYFRVLNKVNQNKNKKTITVTGVVSLFSYVLYLLSTLNNGILDGIYYDAGLTYFYFACSNVLFTLLMVALYYAQFEFEIHKITNNRLYFIYDI